MGRDKRGDDFTDTELEILSRPHREAVLQARTHSYELAAESLGLPIGTFKSRITRARAKMLKRRAPIEPADSVVNG